MDKLEELFDQIREIALKQKEEESAKKRKEEQLKEEREKEYQEYLRLKEKFNNE